MEKKVSVCLIKTDNCEYIDKVIEGLEYNREYISEVIYTGSIDELPETELDIKPLNIESDNRAFLRNQALKEAKEELVFWCSTSTEIEDSTLEEFLEVLEETEDTDIVYPNIVNIAGDEEFVRNFDNWYTNKWAMIQGLYFEELFPEWGVLTKKGLFENQLFDENYKEYEFYQFVFKNLENLNLSLSDLSFVNQYETDSFIDTSFASKIIRDFIVNKYPIQKVFPNLNWGENESLAYSTAYTMIGDALAKYYDFYNASDYYRKALISFHNKHTLRNLINVYMNMGLFNNLKQLLTKDQGFSEEEIENIKRDVQNIENLIKELERKVEEGFIDEVMYSLNDVIQVYQGAPVYNIAGVISFYKGDLLNSYRFFYKATTINPLEEDILRNLTDVAKQIGKKEDVIALVKRLLD